MVFSIALQTLCHSLILGVHGILDSICYTLKQKLYLCLGLDTIFNLLCGKSTWSFPEKPLYYLPLQCTMETAYSFLLFQWKVYVHKWAISIEKFILLIL